MSTRWEGWPATHKNIMLECPLSTEKCLVFKLAGTTDNVLRSQHELLTLTCLPTYFVLNKTANKYFLVYHRMQPQNLNTVSARV